MKERTSLERKVGLVGFIAAGESVGSGDGCERRRNDAALEHAIEVEEFGCRGIVMSSQYWRASRALEPKSGSSGDGTVAALMDC